MGPRSLSTCTCTLSTLLPTKKQAPTAICRLITVLTAGDYNCEAFGNTSPIYCALPSDGGVREHITHILRPA